MRYLLFFTALLLCLTINTAHSVATGLQHYSTSKETHADTSKDTTKESPETSQNNSSEQAPRQNRYHSVITLSDCLKMFGNDSTTLEFQKKYKHHYSKCMSMRRAAERKTMTVSGKTDTEEKTDTTTKDTAADKDTHTQQERPAHKNNGLNHWKRTKTTP